MKQEYASLYSMPKRSTSRRVLRSRLMNRVKFCARYVGKRMRDVEDIRFTWIPTRLKSEKADPTPRRGWYGVRWMM